MSRFTCNEHLCKSVSSGMGAPFLSTTLIFFVYQILQFGNISGLPFASISSIQSVPSLKTPETLPSDESPVTSTITSNLVNSEISSSVSGNLSTKNFQLFIGSPDVNSEFFTSLHPPVINNVSNGQTLSADVSDINFLTSSNMQSSVLPSNFASELETTSDLVSNSFISPTLTSGLSAVPTINIDINSNNFKRELRDTLSQGPCLLNSQSTNNFQSPFSIVPSFANLKPIIPCVACRLPVNFTESSTQNNAQKLNCQDSNKLSNVINSNVASSLSIDFRPCIKPLQNDLTNSYENANSLKFNEMFNNRNVLQNKLNIAQDNSKICSSESGEITNIGQPSPSPFNTLSSIATLKNYVNSKQNLQSCSNSENFINQPIIEMNSSPNQFNQMNSNFQLAQAMNNNKISQQTQKRINSQPNTEQMSQNTMAECDDLINQRNRLAAEYENVLRIRNNVIPQMLSNNVRVKNSPQNNIKNNDNTGCPQLQTVSVNNEVPFIRNSSPLPANNCGCDNNSGNIGFITFNNMARNMKYSQDNNKYTPQNNNQGCPQLMSIPIYKKESLLNKQLARLSSSNNECSQNKNVNNDEALVLSNNKVNFDNNKLTINQNSRGCPQLLALAQNNLYANKNSNVNVNVIVNKQDCDSLEELTDNTNVNNNCNCIQTPLPNDNLVQALKLMSLSKNQPAQVSEGSINILPYGRALLDGKPLPKSYISLDSVGNPEGIQPSTSTDLCNANKFLTIQDVSSVPFSSAPVNQFACVSPQDTPVSIPTNIMMAPSFNPITTPPVATNILPIVLNLSPSVPKIASYTATGPCNQPNSFYNNNIQPMLNLVDNNLNYPLTSTTSCVSPLISSDSVLIQSPQLSFINSVPLATLNDNSVSLSNLPPVYASTQPINSPPCINHVITALPQCNSIQDISVAYPSLNNVVSSITQNILSNLITNLPSAGAPLLKLPPVNSLCSTVVTDSPRNSPICFDISQPQFFSPPLCLPGPSLPEIPVACNEYLPPVYNSAFLPMTFNSGLFCGESDEALDSCSPFYISNTDAFYPEISFIAPTVTSSDCSRLCGPLFMHASSLPQSSPVLKINKTGREAKGFEQLIGRITL